MLKQVVNWAVSAPRRVILVALALFIGAAFFGVPVVGSLSAGGFNDPSSDSARANTLLAQKFGVTDQQLFLLISGREGVHGEPSRRVAAELVDELSQSPYVLNLSSAWTSAPRQAAALVSKDGKSGIIVANLAGTENEAEERALKLAEELAHDRDGVTVRAGGTPLAYAQVNEQSERDLILMEAIAIPLSFVALVWVFGGMFAAALPVLVGLLTIVGSMSALRLITFGTDVSTFALNLTTALGFALAIDYTLLIISRYRDETSSGAGGTKALLRTMTTAGRTVVFSAVTVALAMSVMAIFPMYFLRSFAYAGVITVALAAVSAIVIAPAAIVLLGPRLDALDIRLLLRRIFRRQPPELRTIEESYWYRSTKRVMRHAVPFAIATVSFLLLLGAPFLGVKWGFTDDRLLPDSASAHQVGDKLRATSPSTPQRLFPS